MRPVFCRRRLCRRCTEMSRYNIWKRSINSVVVFCKIYCGVIVLKNGLGFWNAGQLPFLRGFLIRYVTIVARGGISDAEFTTNNGKRETGPRCHRWRNSNCELARKPTRKKLFASRVRQDPLNLKGAQGYTGFLLTRHIFCPSFSVDYLALESRLNLQWLTSRTLLSAKVGWLLLILHLDPGAHGHASLGHHHHGSDWYLSVAYQEVRNDKSDTNWLLLDYESDRSDKLKLTQTGTGGLSELKEALDDSKASYAYVRVSYSNDKESTREKFILVVCIRFVWLLGSHHSSPSFLLNTYLYNLWHRFG